MERRKTAFERTYMNDFFNWTVQKWREPLGRRGETRVSDCFATISTRAYFSVGPLPPGSFASRVIAWKAQFSSADNGQRHTAFRISSAHGNMAHNDLGRGASVRTERGP
jgi:hypothetical protein|eukprot:377211-Prymnesium_polylepis.2